MSKKRIALVTGSSKGLGFETSRQLAQKGITVLMGARDETRGSTSVRTLKNEGLDVHFIHLDVTKSSHIKNAANHIEKAYSTLDILVNNAGMVHAEEPLFKNSVETVSPTALRETFDVNFFGLVELTQALLPLMKKSDAGRIVNISSILGSLALNSDPGSDFYQVKPLAYNTSKTAVNQFTIHLAAALQNTSVIVNSAHPGWVKTDMGGDQAPMEIAEGAQTAVRLATLGENAPAGKFFHNDEELPW